MAILGAETKEDEPVPVIAVKQASPGMRLATPVEDALGRVLINAGEELTDELILVLIRRGFHEIEVRPETALPATGGNRDENTSPDYQAELKRIQTEIAARFERGGNERLKRAALTTLVQRLDARYGETQ
jgi:molybdopterin biosynthesis enzyme